MDRAAPRLIDRGDLLAVLDRAAARQVTIISAPAGSGKTLLRAWAGRPDQPYRLAMMQVRRDHLPAQQEVLDIAEKWRPYRSLATSYLFSAAFEPAEAPPVAPVEP